MHDKLEGPLISINDPAFCIFNRFAYLRSGWRIETSNMVDSLIAASPSPRMAMQP